MPKILRAYRIETSTDVKIKARAAKQKVSEAEIINRAVDATEQPSCRSFSREDREPIQRPKDKR